MNCNRDPRRPLPKIAGGHPRPTTPPWSDVAWCTMGHRQPPSSKACMWAEHPREAKGGLLPTTYFWINGGYDCDGRSIATATQATRQTTDDAVVIGSAGTLEHTSAAHT